MRRSSVSLVRCPLQRFIKVANFSRAAAPFRDSIRAVQVIVAFHRGINPRFGLDSINRRRMNKPSQQVSEYALAPFVVYNSGKHGNDSESILPTILRTERVAKDPPLFLVLVFDGYFGRHRFGTVERSRSLKRRVSFQVVGVFRVAGGQTIKESYRGIIGGKGVVTAYKLRTRIESAATV